MKNKIITFLKNSETYISGEDLSRKLDISRSAIWKYVQELRSQGFVIEAVPHLGYQLKSIPDKLFPSEVQFQLKTKVFGKKIIYLDSLESTMDEAFQLAMNGANEGTIVCCETQTKGKGRMGRKWSSPKGKGLYFSLILRPRMGPSQAARLTLMSAVALCEALRQETKLDVNIKWPNDLLIDGKKIAGILTELSAEMDGIRFVVIGVGINVNTPNSLLLDTATSVKNETGKSFSRVEIFQSILSSLEQWYIKVKDGDFGEVIDRWKELSSTLGRDICLQDQGGNVSGLAVDLSDDGALVIKNQKGVVMKRMTGDVVYG
ncbi:Biotin operon repressor / Biotin--protein ligase [hydrothermal vent metagenome]|uniref:Biotin operon repressor / Biotin--protein ligase n=1 Tax=hydrothermal vent metagenome TaxID=652676 RepID=A0A3B0TC96_9ZZZZ